MNSPLKMNDAPPDQSYMDRHWEKIGARALSDFRNTALAAKILRLLPANPGQILDAGCGLGTFVIHARKQGYDALGIDVSPSQIEQGRKLFAAEGIDPQQILLASVEDMLKGRRRFGVCVALDVIEHLENPVEFLAAIGRMLIAPALLLVSVPAIPSFFDRRDELSGHFRRYEPETLRLHLESGGFCVSRMQYWNLLGFLQTWLRKTLLGKQQTNECAFRYSDSSGSRLLNAMLSQYFRLIENRVRPPVGLSLIAVAALKS